MPDVVLGGRAVDKAVGLLPKPAEDSALCLDEQDSDLDSTTEEIWMQKTATW